MDKKLLLAVLCLQVFLLITTFTSSDAAALKTADLETADLETADLETADLRQPPHRQRRPGRYPKGKNSKKKWKRRGCLHFRGACGPGLGFRRHSENIGTILRRAQKSQ